MLTSNQHCHVVRLFHYAKKCTLKLPYCASHHHVSTDLFSTLCLPRSLNSHQRKNVLTNAYLRLASPVSRNLVRRGLFDSFRKRKPDYLLQWMQEHDKFYLFESPIRVFYSTAEIWKIGTGNLDVLRENYGIEELQLGKYSAKIGHLFAKHQRETKEALYEKAVRVISLLHASDFKQLEDILTPKLLRSVSQKLHQLTGEQQALLRSSVNLSNPEVSRYVKYRRFSTPFCAVKHNDSVYVKVLFVCPFPSGFVVNVQLSRALEDKSPLAENFVVDVLNIFQAYEKKRIFGIEVTR